MHAFQAVCFNCLDWSTSKAGKVQFVGKALLEVIFAVNRALSDDAALLCSVSKDIVNTMLTFITFFVHIIIFSKSKVINLFILFNTYGNAI